MWNVDIAVIFTTFPVIFLAELPDKTFIAALVLATRFRHLWVWPVSYTHLTLPTILRV